MKLKRNPKKQKNETENYRFASQTVDLSGDEWAVLSKYLNHLQV